MSSSSEQQRAAADFNLEANEDLFPEGSTPPPSPPRGNKGGPELPPQTPVRGQRFNNNNPYSRIYQQQRQQQDFDGQRGEEGGEETYISRKRPSFVGGANATLSDGNKTLAGWGVVGQQTPPNITWLHKRRKTLGPQGDATRGSCDGASTSARGTAYVPRTLEERQQSRPDFPPSAKLEMFHFTILYYVPGDGTGNFFELLNPARPESPLRLYRNAMVILCEKLPKALADAKKMEGGDFPDDTQVEVAVINQFKNARVILSIGIYGGVPHIWLRLYAKTEDDEIIPSTYGVKFSLADNVQKLYDFVIENK